MRNAISAEIGIFLGHLVYTVTAYRTPTTGPYLNLIHNRLKYTKRLIVNRSRMISAIHLKVKLKVNLLD